MPDPPTRYPDLNELLDEFVAHVRAILADNFCGAYLQGSFAVGDADAHSDVDFIVVTEREVTAEQRADLQTMHERLFGLATPWAQHLEGSYVPRASLRRLDPERRPFLYLDNGATELVDDNHCNTNVVRWSLRECGITLAGPPIESLVDLVSREQLSVDIRSEIDECVAYSRSLDVRFPSGMSRWKQQFLVQWFCRALHTLELGRVTSKARAGEWALAALGEEWRQLIRQALDDRPDPWGRVHEPATAEDAEKTIAFVEFCRAAACRRTPALKDARA